MSGPFNQQPRPQSTVPLADTVHRDPWNRPITQNNRDDMRDNSTRTGNTDNRSGNGQQQNDNNNTDNDVNVDDIWKDIKKENSQGDDRNNVNNQNNQPAPDMRKPEEKLKEYLDSVGIKPIVLDDRDKEDLKNGEFGNVLNRINDQVAQSHIQGLKSMNTVIEAKVAAAVEAAVGKSRAAFEGDKALTALQSAHPWTKDPVIGPIAQTIMQQFITKGATPEQAIVGVGKYFDRVDEKRNGGKVNSNRNGNFRGPADNSETSGDVDWVDLLTPKPSNR